MALKGKLAEAFVDIKANTKNYELGLNRVKGSLANIISLTAIAFAAKKLLDFGKSAIQLGSDFIETRNKFKTVFSGIQGDAEETAKTLAKSFGLASGTAEELLASTGDLLTGFGFTQKEALKLSKQVNDLAGDLSSFQNTEGGVKVASQRLTKAILGETESAKSLGIVIRQNTKEFKASVRTLMEEKNITEAQAKAHLILAQALEQSKNAIGDYAKTADEFANQQKKLNEQWKEWRAEIGKVLVKMATGIELLPKMNDGLEEQNEKLKELNKTANLWELTAIKFEASLKRLNIIINAPKFWNWGSTLGDLKEVNDEMDRLIKKSNEKYFKNAEEVTKVEKNKAKAFQATAKAMRAQTGSAESLLRIAQQAALTGISSGVGGGGPSKVASLIGKTGTSNTFNSMLDELKLSNILLENINRKTTGAKPVFV